MSPMLQPYVPSSHQVVTSVDAINRHDYGVQKPRKSASTGGGRAWTEDEEVYLLQTRLQKMPYKHIAAHLKKTELACRLHYYQLSRGSTRRKRTPSNTIATGLCSPAMSTTSDFSRLPSPSRDNQALMSPPMYHYPSMSTNSHQIQLPSILPRCSSTTPPRSLAPVLPITILHRPTMSARSQSESSYHLYREHNTASPQYQYQQQSQQHDHIDHARLQHVYQRHGAKFWASIAEEYGSNVGPEAIERYWQRNGSDLASRYVESTPASSPPPDQTYTKSAREDSKISVSALLGIDASPRSPKDREMVRLMEAQARERA